MTDKDRRLARWLLGVSHRVGSDLCCWLVTELGKLILKTSVEHVMCKDYLDPNKKKSIEEFDVALAARLDDANFQLQADPQFQGIYLEDIKELKAKMGNAGVQHEEENTTLTDEEHGDMIFGKRPEEDNEKAVDKHLNAELILVLGSNNKRQGRVVKRSWGLDGQPIGCACTDTNPLFDTYEHDIEFTDGTMEKHQANVIVENVFTQVDDEGWQFAILDKIVEHWKDNMANPMSEDTVRSNNGQEKPKKTTRGWHLLVQWKDGSMEWVKMKDLRASNPNEVAELAVANRITDEPAFKWWAPCMLQRWNRINSKVKSRCWKQSHKFGIWLSKMWWRQEALQIDEIMVTDFWRKVINKEMSRVKVALKAKEGYTPEQARHGEAPDLIGFQEIGCHVVLTLRRFCKHFFGHFRAST